MDSTTTATFCNEIIIYDHRFARELVGTNQHDGEVHDWTSPLNEFPNQTYLNEKSYCANDGSKVVTLFSEKICHAAIFKTAKDILSQISDK